MTQLHQDIDPELDRIERSIDIDASAAKVWELITRPGWWINEGEVDEVAAGTPRRRPRRGHAPEVGRVPDPDAGARRAAPHRLPLARQRVGRRHHRRVPGAERAGGVTLSVVETGFLSLDKSREDVLHHIEENSGGWETELAAAGRYVTGAAA